MTGQTKLSSHLDTRGALVVGVDDSPNAAAAASFARVLAHRTGAVCRFVHAVEPGHDPVAAGLRVREALGAVQPPLGLDDLEIRVGHPTEVLLALAADLSGAVLIVGGKHHSLLGRWVAGSTAVALVRASPIPVLVTRGPVGKISRVLVGADASGAAFGAIRHAEAWAELWHAELRVAHAVPLPPLLPEYSTGFDLEMLRVSGEREAAREVFPLIGREGTERVVEIGGAAEVLSEQVRSWQPELLVVARHDRGWLSRAALGSVTERLLDGLPTSLLVVPATPTATGIARAKVTPEEVAR